MENKQLNIINSKFDFLTVGSNKVFTISWVSGTIKVSPEKVIPFGPFRTGWTGSEIVMFSLLVESKTVEFVLLIVKVIKSSKKKKILNEKFIMWFVCAILGKVQKIKNPN